MRSHVVHSEREVHRQREEGQRAHQAHLQERGQAPSLALRPCRARGQLTSQQNTAAFFLSPSPRQQPSLTMSLKKGSTMEMMHVMPT